MAEQLKLERVFFGEMHPIMLDSDSASEDSKVMNDCLKLHFPLCWSANMSVIYPWLPASCFFVKFVFEFTPDL